MTEQRDKEAARIARVLVGQPVPRRTTTIATLAGLSLTRTRRILEQLERIGSARRNRDGCWTA